jgi:type I site-specific restriction endonuclease
MKKQALSERDICTKFITPAVKQAGWDEMTQIREEVGWTRLCRDSKRPESRWSGQSIG